MRRALADHPALWAATAMATVLLMVGVKWLELHRQPPRPTWVVLETRYAGPHGRLLGISVDSAYHSRQTCRARRPLTGTLELREPRTRVYHCVLVGRPEPWR